MFKFGSQLFSFSNFLHFVDHIFFANYTVSDPGLHCLPNIMPHNFHNVLECMNIEIYFTISFTWISYRCVLWLAQVCIIV